MTLMRLSLFLSALTIAGLAGGCAKQPPAGKPIELSAEDQIASFGARSLWWSWHAKGLKEQMLGRREQALFCFLKAERAWPATLPADEEQLRPPGALPNAPPPTHRPVAVESLMKIAELYTALGEPTWALAALDRIDQAMPKGMNLTRSQRVDTLAKFPKSKAAQWPR